MPRAHECLRSRDPLLSRLLKGALSGLLGLGLGLGILSCGGGGGGGSTTTPTPAADFTLQIPQTQMSAAAGTSAQVTVFANRTNGHTDAVALSLDAPPAGITASGSIPAGAASGTLTLTTAPTTGAQLYFLNVRGTAGSLTRTVAFTLVVTSPAQPDFSLSASIAGPVPAGQQGSATIQVVRSGGHASAITLGIASNAAGVTGSGSIPAGQNAGVLPLTVPASTPAGTYSLTVEGLSGSLTRTTALSLVVTSPAQPDFSLSASIAGPIPAGQQGSASVQAVRSGGHTGAIALAIASNAQGVVGTGSIPAGQNTGVLPVMVPSSTPLGTYLLTVEGVSGGLTRTTTLSLTVSPALRIVAFTAAPPVVRSGGSSTLSWSVQGADEIRLSGVGPVTGSSLVVRPAATTTYTLTAVRGAFTQSQDVVITVQTGTLFLFAPALDGARVVINGVDTTPMSAPPRWT